MGSRIQLIRSRIFRAHFDARIFPVPEDDVCNYFLWRQRDAVRNSVLAAGQSALPRWRMHGMKCGNVRAALAELGQPWEGLPVRRRRGFSVVRSASAATEEAAWSIDGEPPDFGEDREYIERWLAPDPSRLRHPAWVSPSDEALASVNRGLEQAKTRGFSKNPPDLAADEAFADSIPDECAIADMPAPRRGATLHNCTPPGRGDQDEHPLSHP